MAQVGAQVGAHHFSQRPLPLATVPHVVTITEFERDLDCFQAFAYVLDRTGVNPTSITK